MISNEEFGAQSRIVAHFGGEKSFLGRVMKVGLARVELVLVAVSLVDEFPLFELRWSCSAMS